MKRVACLTLISCVAISFSIGQNGIARTAEQTVRPIIDRIIRETAFELRTVPLKPTLDIQVVDFGSVFAGAKGSVGCAFSVIYSPADTTIRFGIGRDLPLNIVLNGRSIVSAKDAPKFVFRENGYEVFQFNETLKLPLKKGANIIVLKGKLVGEHNVVYLREITNPRKSPRTRFEPAQQAPALTGHTWGFLGPFNDPSSRLMSVKVPPEPGYQETYTFQGKKWIWRFAGPKSVQELVIRPDATFSRESYAEWEYPNGTVMLSLLQYSDVKQDQAVQSFVSRFCSFTISNLPLARNQYERLHAFRGMNHRLIRQGMLDDTGAPGLPFVEIALRKHDPMYGPLVFDVARYIMEGQMRLSDSTLCRPEPEMETVWADDLFMSTPYLMRMAKLTGQEKYYHEAARQVLNFNKYLEDMATGLYRHGWYNAGKRQTPISWGRANGWVIWATSEILSMLQETHPLRRQVVAIFQRHIKAIARFQGESGLWHQVLDRPASFEETSCTAMFMIGMARGMRLGVLDQSFEPILKKAWQGLQSKISDAGIVNDICRGTDIGDDFDFYNKRERFDNDPRGLGAVITACVEMMIDNRGGR